MAIDVSDNVDELRHWRRNDAEYIGEAGCETGRQGGNEER